MSIIKKAIELPLTNDIANNSSLGGNMKKTGFWGSQAGFNLVELAIVLVILGIILGAVLQGREMINNARIKRVLSQEQEISAAVFSYQDRYGFFPGDDNTANGRWGAVNGNANGVINSTVGNSINCTAGEGCQLWDHLRRANFISSGTGIRNVSNTYGGQIGIFNGAINGGAAVNWMQFTNIPAETVSVLDTKNDDGVWNTGNIQGSAAYNANTTIVMYFRL
jgi:prepilin-type N-terminal cleavage/methylation domain-containing protein